MAAYGPLLVIILLLLLYMNL